MTQSFVFRAFGLGTGKDLASDLADQMKTVDENSMYLPRHFAESLRTILEAERQFGGHGMTEIAHGGKNDDPNACY